VSVSSDDPWMRHMRAGRFEQAWRISDEVLRSRGRLESATVPRHLQAIWDGAPMAGKRVLVRCYHGLGDTIQFIRYIPLLSETAAEVIVWAQPALLPLLSQITAIDRLLPLTDGRPPVDYDVDVELMELPHVFRTTVDTIPAVPYLHAERWPVQPGRPAVGLVWRAGDWGPHRSIAFDLLGPLLEAPVTWYVLQGAPGVAECPPGFGIHAGTHDIVEAARVISSLDLLITVDSMAAHLAGALGTRVWTLLAHEADWRWMEDRDDSPWYPTMRLFRQPHAGAWPPVIASVAEHLQRLVTDWEEYGPEEARTTARVSAATGGAARPGSGDVAAGRSR
jgi:hypothetical protein